MRLRLISEGRERAEAIRDDIRSGKHSFRYLSRKYGVSIPYISAVAKRLGMGRIARKPVETSKVNGLRPGPLISNIPSLGVVRNR